MSKTTLKDIAQRAGVSVTTVSRVLNGMAEQYRIKPETAESIFHAAADLNFSPYKSILKPELPPLKTIGLIIPDISHFFLSRLARIISLELQKAGYAVLMCDSGEDTELEKSCVELLSSRLVSGLIVLPVGIEFGHLQKVYAQGTPIVCVDRIHPDLQCPTVSIDNYGGARLAMDYLIERGHRRIACIQRLPEAWINSERLRAFREALTEHGLPIEASLLIGDSFAKANGYLEGKLLLSRRDRPTAVFALSHVLTFGVLQALREESLTIPKDISLISFDDLPFSEYLEKKVTTVSQPLDEMALLAVSLLISQLRSDQRPNAAHIVLRPSLIRRESVKRL